MKRILILLSAAALVAMASCTKNELAPSATAEQEITFQTAVGALKTRAAANSFDTNAGFHSYVYKHTDAFETAKANAANFASYISSGIKYVENYPEAGKKAWKADATYYWPKSDYLTFYAVSDGVTKPFSVAGETVSVGCDPIKGIQISNYELTANVNKDILVADAMKDMKSTSTMTSTSEGEKAWVNGVPTVFKHKLSSFAFKAKTDKAYDGTSFYIRSIKFYQANGKGNYSQATNAWESSVPATFNMFTAASDNGQVAIPATSDIYGVKITADGTTTTALPASTNAGDYTILMPQELTASDEVKAEVEYYIVTNYTGSDVSEKVLYKDQLKVVYPESWEVGKKYTLTLTLNMKEINWDPASEAWTDGAVLNPFEL